ncbi:hypothetical protein [Pseudoalteromonas sp. C12FD-1]|uniref:hypothetical protein n=1 Tax=Pseudoalteromonas sp. C12FD-1 TaxID=3131979 RepID=UPI00307F358B
MMNILTKDMLNVATGVSFSVLMLTLITEFGFNFNEPIEVMASAKVSSSTQLTPDDVPTPVSNADYKVPEEEKRATQIAVKNDKKVLEKQKKLLAQATSENVKQFTDHYKQLPNGNKSPAKANLTTNNAVTLATLRTIKN